MNELIRKFAEQSEGDTICECGSTGFDYKKFAELIVRECCDIFVELRTRPADLAVKDVKKHFGVEE
jgi:hypothetical protein